MDCEKNVGFDRFPKQGSMLGKEVWVCFDYDEMNILYGEVVRDDAEEPHRTIIRLKDGRYVLAEEPYQTIIRLEDGMHVLATECNYTPSQFQQEKQLEIKNLSDAILDLQKRLADIERTMEYNAEVERNRQEM